MLRLAFAPLLTCCLFWNCPAQSADEATPQPNDGNRPAYLDECNPWYPDKDFPKLITPQWVGEEGVECVIILAIDDMRDTAKYEQHLRPILDRLKQIDGRAPLSIMTNAVDAVEPDQLLPSCVENIDASPETFGVNEGQADGDDFVGLTRVTRHISRANRLVGRQRGARAAP